jgi:hypothetical protein
LGCGIGTGVHCEEIMIQIDWRLYISILFLAIALMKARVDIDNLKEGLDQLKKTCNIEQVKED